VSNKAIVLELIEQGLAGGNKQAILDRVAEDYIQHNPRVPTGRAPLLALPQLEVRIARVLAAGDLVATHGEYVWDGQRVTAFDIFRVVDGRLVEHWDAMQPTSATTASGRGMLDGPTEIVDLDQTTANTVLVRTFVEQVLIGGAFDRADTVIDATHYAQHNPAVGDGLDAFFQFAGELARQGISFGYHRVHHVIGEGNFVLVASEGEFGGQATAFYDLFRLEKGKIVEHWDVIQAIPSHMAHDNGMF
jgi:predicted SnoaL-like aldol condensation-catalyzing enzyme